MSLYVNFIGAIGRVTGSCTWLYHEPSDTELLVDCGMYQGEADFYQKNKAPFPFNPKRLKLVLLTHAHIDHCGLIPRLYREGFKGEIWCNDPTADLAEISLDDSTNLCDGLYSQIDRRKVRFKRLADTRKPIRLADNLAVVLTRTSHQLGSAAFEISWWEGDDMTAGKTICFSGDVGNNRKDNAFQSLLKGRQLPAPHCDYIVCESTYGDRQRDTIYEDFNGRILALAKLVEEAYSSDDTPIIIVPAFACQRTQEVLIDLYYLFSEYIESNPDQFTRPTNAFDDLLNGCAKSSRIRQILESHLLAENEIKSLMDELVEDDEGALRLTPSTGDAHKARLKKLLSNQVLWGTVVCNSPLAKKYGEVFSKYLSRPKGSNEDADFEHLNDEFLQRVACSSEEISPLMNWVFTGNRESRKGLSKNSKLSISYVDPDKELKPRANFPAFIVSSSGMCEHGPIRPVIEKHIQNPNAMIVLSGYQGPGNFGESLKRVMQLQVGGDGKDFQIELESGFVAASQVKAKIRDMSAYYSGHADAKGLLEYLMTNALNKPMHRATVFLNHGDPQSRENLKNAIESAGADSQRPIDKVLLPGSDSGWYDLTHGRYCDPPVDATKGVSDDRILESLNTIIDLLRRQTELQEQHFEFLMNSRNYKKKPKKTRT